MNNNAGAARVVSKIIHEKDASGAYPTTRGATRGAPHCQRLDIRHEGRTTGHGTVQGAHVHEYPTQVHTMPDGTTVARQGQNVRPATPHDFRWPEDTSIPPTRDSGLSQYPSS